MNIIMQVFFYISQNFPWTTYLGMEEQDLRNDNDNNGYLVLILCQTLFWAVYIY